MLRAFLAAAVWFVDCLYAFRGLLTYAAIVLFCVFGTQWVVWALIRAAKPC